MRKGQIQQFLYAIVAALVPQLSNAAASAEQLQFGHDLDKAGWSIVSFPFIAAANFKAIDNSTVEVSAVNAAGLAWHVVAEVSGKVQVASWSWRVDEGIGPTDLSVRGEDDRALAIYFIFGDTSDRSKDVMTLLGTESVTTLVYVFGGNTPRGSLIDSPHMKTRGRFIVLQPATALHHQWLNETVDLVADYIRAFGRHPPNLLGVAISSDSDDMVGQNQARVRGLSVGD